MRLTLSLMARLHDGCMNTSSSSYRREGMLLGMQFGNGYGSQPGAWRMPGVDPASYADFDVMARHAQAAERGLIDFLFLPDGLGLDDDVEHYAPKFSLEPTLTLAAIARATSRIGLVMTGSTTFNEAYSLARQLKTLDVMSHGRVGWNAVPTSGDLAAANFGKAIPPRGEVRAPPRDGPNHAGSLGQLG